MPRLIAAWPTVFPDVDEGRCDRDPTLDEGCRDSDRVVDECCRDCDSIVDEGRSDRDPAVDDGPCDWNKKIVEGVSIRGHDRASIGITDLQAGEGQPMQIHTLL